MGGGSPHGVMVNVLNSNIEVSEFKLQSHYYIHFQTNTHGKGMNSQYPSNYRLNSTTTVLLWHCIIHEVWYVIKQSNQTKLRWEQY